VSETILADLARMAETAKTMATATSPPADKYTAGTDSSSLAMTGVTLTVTLTMGDRGRARGPRHHDRPVQHELRWSV